MVRIERISRKAPEPEVDPTGERFKLLDVHVQEPTVKPDDSLRVAARPYEFENDRPSKYATSCPHCGQGIWFERHDVRVAVDKFFIGCPECGKGVTSPLQPIVDPFVNPVTEKIAEVLLDSDLNPAQEKITPDTKTVKEKLEAASADLAPCIDTPQPTQSTFDDEAPSDDEVNEIIDKIDDPSELERVLEELEDKNE